MANLTVRNALPTSFFNENDPFKMMRDMLRWEPFGTAPANFTAPTTEFFAPAFDVKETVDGFTFKADLPGVKEADLDITFSSGRLLVHGKREKEKEEKGDTYYAFERSTGEFSRTFMLPEGIDIAHATAELKEGVLTIALPRTHQEAPRKIAVTNGGKRN